MIGKGSVKQASIFLTREDHGNVAVRGMTDVLLGYRLNHGDSGGTDGIWLEWSWRDNRFELNNDRYGMYPAFFYRTERELYVSTNIIDLLENGAPTDFDDAAIAVFLRLGFYIGDTTPFKAIRAVPPGATLLWGAGGFSLKSGRIPTPRPVATLSTAAAIGYYGELFQWSTERLVSALGDRIVLPLSGGRDSRHILFALKRANRMPDCCVTVQLTAGNLDEDTAVAAAVTKHLQGQHVAVEQSRALLDAELQKNELTSFCADEHAWVLPLRRYLEMAGPAAVLDGIGGDVLSAGLYLNAGKLDLYHSGRLPLLAEEILGQEGYLARMLKPAAYRRWGRELAIAHLADELDKHSGSANPVAQFYFWNRTRREIALSCWAILTDPCHVFAPYLCAEVYDFLASLPASMFLDHTFHTKTIAQSYPEYAHLPFESKTGKKPSLTRATIARFCAGAARYCLPRRSSGGHVNYATFLVPRLVRALIDSEFGSLIDGLCSVPVYLSHLERAASHEISRHRAKERDVRGAGPRQIVTHRGQ